jgi:hypothetical protein
LSFSIGSSRGLRFGRGHNDCGLEFDEISEEELAQALPVDGGARSGALVQLVGDAPPAAVSVRQAESRVAHAVLVQVLSVARQHRRVGLAHFVVAHELGESESGREVEQVAHQRERAFQIRAGRSARPAPHSVTATPNETQP